MSTGTTSEKLKQHLQTLSKTPGVQTVLVVDRLGNLREKMSKGADQAEALKAMAKYLQPVISALESAGALKHLHIRYTQSSFYVRGLASGDFLALLMDTTKSLQELLPAINLAIMGIERSFQDGAMGSEHQQNQGLNKLLASAENALQTHLVSGETFYGGLRLLCSDYLGTAGPELVDNGVDELWLTPPIKIKNQMESLVEYVVHHVPPELKRQALQRDALRLIAHHTHE